MSLDPPVLAPTEPDTAEDRVSGASEPAAVRSWPWLFQRSSGALLAVLAAAHFADRFLVNDTTEVGTLFLAERWRSAGWQLLEWSFLVLATAHGLIGLRWSLRRHVRNPTTRIVIEGFLGGVTGCLFLVAAWVVFTLP